MSSILKALRKLEEEKARSNAGSPDIARDILKRGPRRKSSVPWLAPFLTVVLLAGGLAGYVLMEKPEHAPLPGAPAKNIDEAPAVATPSLPKEKSAIAVEPRPIKPTIAHSPHESPIRTVKKSTENASSSTTTKALPKPAAAPVKKRLSSPVATKVSFVEPVPKLLLSGIAYQEERGARLAVVNDLPVMEGTMIEGARVEMIFKDRVRFVYAGRSFEVFLGQSTAAK